MTNEPSRELETLRQVSERLETERAECEAASKQLVEARRRKIALESLGPGLYYRRAKSAQWQNTKELWRILLPMLRAALALKLRGRKPDPNLLSSFYDRSTEIEVENVFQRLRDDDLDGRAEESACCRRLGGFRRWWTPHARGASTPETSD